EAERTAPLPPSRLGRSSGRGPANREGGSRDRQEQPADDQGVVSRGPLERQTARGLGSRAAEAELLVECCGAGGEGFCGGVVGRAEAVLLVERFGAGRERFCGSGVVGGAAAVLLVQCFGAGRERLCRSGLAGSAQAVLLV